jgi:hypothetical protein
MARNFDVFGEKILRVVKISDPDRDLFFSRWRGRNRFVRREKMGRLEGRAPSRPRFRNSDDTRRGRQAPVVPPAVRRVRICFARSETNRRRLAAAKSAGDAKQLLALSAAGIRIPLSSCPSKA